MKVSDAIKLLSGFPQDAELVMAKDAEGNDYSPMAGMWLGKYRATTTWYGEVGLAGLDDELIQRGYTDEDVMSDGVVAVIVVPTN